MASRAGAYRNPSVTSVPLRVLRGTVLQDPTGLGYLSTEYTEVTEGTHGGLR